MYGSVRGTVQASPPKPVRFPHRGTESTVPRIRGSTDPRLRIHGSADPQAHGFSVQCGTRIHGSADSRSLYGSLALSATNPWGGEGR